MDEEDYKDEEEYNQDPKKSQLTKTQRNEAEKAKTEKNSFEEVRAKAKNAEKKSKIKSLAKYIIVEFQLKPLFMELVILRAHLKRKCLHIHNH